jgi:hypothetical protein
MTAEEKAAELYPYEIKGSFYWAQQILKQEGFISGANWQAYQHQWVVEALENLVQLKRWKDKHGKDEHYVRNVDSAWQKAFEAIDNLTKKPHDHTTDRSTCPV